MNSNEPRSQGRRKGPGGRRNSRNQRGSRDQRNGRDSRPAQAPKKLTFWQKLISFFTGGPKKPASPQPKAGHVSRPPERVEVTTPKLYVGNLSYRVSDSDLFDLFKGAGEVQNAEVATDRNTDQSKGFGFVTMDSVDEAKRAAEKLHDKDFMGRRLVVSGAKNESRRDY